MSTILTHKLEPILRLEPHPTRPGMLRSLWTGAVWGRDEDIDKWLVPADPADDLQTPGEFLVEREASAVRAANRDFAEHVLTVLHDRDGYKHYLCGKPGSGFYRFEVLAAPHLTVVYGDIGDVFWSRSLDGLFRSLDDINYPAGKPPQTFKKRSFESDYAEALVNEEYARRVEELLWEEPEGNWEKGLEKHREIREELQDKAQENEHDFLSAWWHSDWYTDELPEVTVLSRDVLWAVECLRWLRQRLLRNPERHEASGALV